MTLDALKGYTVSGFAILSGLTLNQWVALFGLLGVVATFVFQLRRDRRETVALQIQIGERPSRRASERRCADRECPPPIVTEE